MLGLLLATTLAIQCTVVNFDPHPTLVCSDEKRSVLVIPYSEWPEVWHGPEMGFAYPMDDGGRAIASVRNEAKLAESVRRSRFHQRRFMREALQNPKKEP